MVVIHKNEHRKICDGLTNDEFRCHCKDKECRATMVFEGFIWVYERFRQAIGLPLIITSGFRCAKHNYDVGGVAISRHLVGCAVDIAINTLTDTYDLEAVERIAKNVGFSFTKCYPEKGIIHMDVR